LGNLICIDEYTKINPDIRPAQALKKEFLVGTQCKNPPNPLGACLIPNLIPNLFGTDVIKGSIYNEEDMAKVASLSYAHNVWVKLMNSHMVDDPEGHVDDVLAIMIELEGENAQKKYIHTTYGGPTIHIPATNPFAIFSNVTDETPYEKELKFIKAFFKRLMGPHAVA